MAYNFNEDDKEVKEYADRIPFGKHEVVITAAEAGATEDDKDFIEVHVENKEGTEDKARVWFTGGASNISFNTLRQIIVHSAESEADKAKARDAVDACGNTDDLVKLLNKHCIGTQIWLTKYFDPVRTYVAGNGETKRSINTNIYGYEPKLKPELMPSAEQDKAALNKTFPGAEDVTNDPSSTVPNNWA